MLFICPVCASRLSLSNSSALVCERGHSFDRSRDGYYNLLISSGGGQHGDNKEMLAARRDFLNTGAYAPLSEAIASTVLGSVRNGDVLLDIGCGEGYYTDALERKIASSGVPAEVFGFDISKDAVRLAAKRNRRAHFAVASAYKMPVPDASVNIATNVFSPLAIEETRRTLVPGGRFIMAIPGELHLFGLKAAIYDKPYKNEPQPSALSGLRLISEREIKYELGLDSAEKIRNLFMMTPYAYRTPPEARERVLGLRTLECLAHFIVFEYEKL